MALPPDVCVESREPVSAGTRSRKFVRLVFPESWIAVALNEVIGLGAANSGRNIRDPVTTTSDTCASDGEAAAAFAGEAEGGDPVEAGAVCALTAAEARLNAAAMINRLGAGRKTITNALKPSHPRASHV